MLVKGDRHAEYHRQRHRATQPAHRTAAQRSISGNNKCQQGKTASWPPRNVHRMQPDGENCKQHNRNVAALLRPCTHGQEARGVGIHRSSHPGIRLVHSLKFYDPPTPHTSACRRSCQRDACSQPPRHAGTRGVFAQGAGPKMPSELKMSVRVTMPMTCFSLSTTGTRCILYMSMSMAASMMVLVGWM